VPNQASMQPAAPSSPCISVCVLDAAGLCTGCRRSVQEITRWSRMSAQEQWAVIDSLPARTPGPAARRATGA
jgi:uncharacterized protein